MLAGGKTTDSPSNNLLSLVQGVFTNSEWVQSTYSLHLSEGSSQGSSKKSHNLLETVYTYEIIQKKTYRWKSSFCF